MSDDDRCVTANLTVHATDTQQAVHMMETLNRVMLGLVLEGFDTELYAGLEPDYYGEPEPVFDETDENEE